MPNFFTDNADLKAAFERLRLEEVVAILEQDYTEVTRFPEAPADYAEAIDAYRSALELVGDIAGNFIAPRAADIDQEGARLEAGEVIYARGTEEAYRRLGDAGLMGAIVPRRFGGLNFPATIYMMMIEMVSRADASMMTLFGYQDVAEAIAHFAPEEVAERYLPSYTAGRSIGAMVLTEPGAGSDLQAIRLRASLDDDGTWRLNGVKQFISNGNGDLLLVLARSEPAAPGMFGLSLFVSNGGEGVTVNRIEEKMGLHGSPTCELHFDDAPAHLVGKRRFGLIHVLHMLNHARFSVGAQALGIAEAAWEAAVGYAHQREQFGRLIVTMPPVADLLTTIRVRIEAGRALLYAGSQWLDLRNKLETRIERLRREGQPVSHLKPRFDQAAAIVDLLSPAVKYWVTEAANRVCYDAQQVHGGMGYMREMAVERLARDVRITTIYEGTTQVQVGSSLSGTMADVLGPVVAELAQRERPPELEEAAAALKELREVFDHTRRLLEEAEPSVREASGRGLVDMYLGLYAGHLLVDQAAQDGSKTLVARRLAVGTLADAHAARSEVERGLRSDLDRAPRLWS